ncbi:MULTISPECIES: hypothetical protein [Streptomyces]|uniref:hypothetical protein n=1 Tax=Streptomyces TaxID=1883 RepID=UPI000F71F5BF|nr:MULTISPECIES: hypothetical protein [unclassified Streptomyces]AZM88373.1 hypothetical protein D1J60_07645 [Streptomyces sp. W1SF4]RSS53674.1 hypothetical protein EF912_17585 [Streptomyces sp. WAC07061]
MLWPMLAIVLGFLGLAVLSVLALRVFLEVRRLAGQVALASRRITEASGDLERAAADLARAGRAAAP